MTAKEYLGQTRFLDMRINSKIQQIASLNELATRCTVTISDMPRNPNRGGSRMADAVMKIVDLEEELNKDIHQLVELKSQIRSRIKMVSNVEYQTILEKRYLCFLSWEQISVDMSYSIQHIFRIHEKALKEIDDLLQDESK